MTNLLVVANVIVLWLAALVLGGILELTRAAELPADVSWWGHLGGLVSGLILVSLDRYLRFALPGAKRRWQTS